MARRLQGPELACQEIGRHEMAFPAGETARDQWLRTAEKDDTDITSSMHEHIAIGALERGAGDDRALAGAAEPVDLVGDGLQPWPAILVAQGMPGLHLGHVACGVKRVAVLVAPMQPSCQCFRDRALARAGHAHHDERVKCGTACVMATKILRTARPCRPARRSGRRSNEPGWPAGSRH